MNKTNEQANALTNHVTLCIRVCAVRKIPKRRFVFNTICVYVSITLIEVTCNKSLLVSLYDLIVKIVDITLYCVLEAGLNLYAHRKCLPFHPTVYFIQEAVTNSIVRSFSTVYIVIALCVYAVVVVGSF